MLHLRMLALAAGLASLSALAQPGPDTADGRYVQVRTEEVVPAQTINKEGEQFFVPAHTRKVLRWVWVPVEQPNPPGTVRGRLTAEIDIPAVVIPEVGR